MEPVAEVSEVLPPSTTAETVLLKLEPQLDTHELASSTIEIPPSSVEESTPAPAPVASNASIPLDAPEPVVDETATTVVEKAEVAPNVDRKCYRARRPCYGNPVCECGDPEGCGCEGGNFECAAALLTDPQSMAASILFLLFLFFIPVSL
jgi:hypothetical protein